MSSSRAPSNQGMVSLTRSQRASIPSVPSMMRASSENQSAFSTSPWKAAITITKAKTLPAAV